MKRTLLLLCFCSIMVMPVSSAQANIIEFFFPSLRQDDPDPSDTLQAPFADEEAQKEKPLAKGQLPENALALDKPHRDASSLGDWLVNTASDVMTFTHQDYRQDLKEVAPYFSQRGRTEFSKFLQEKGILKALQSQRFYLRCFVEDMPLLLNEGVVDGRYRWLYEVPMSVSYMDRNMRNYKESLPKATQKMVLKIELGRSAEAQNSEGLHIENWSGRIKK